MFRVSSSTKSPKQIEDLNVNRFLLPSHGILGAGSSLPRVECNVKVKEKCWRQDEAQDGAFVSG